MKNTIRSRYSYKLTEDTAGDGYYRYFQDIYSDAYNHFKNGNHIRAFILFHRGSRQYSTLFHKGANLSQLIFDECSLWLCAYYSRHNCRKRLNKILNRNFVCYNGNYYHLTTGKIVWRMVPIKELDPEYDYGMDSPQDEQTDKIVLRMIKERRGVL